MAVANQPQPLTAFPHLRAERFISLMSLRRDNAGVRKDERRIRRSGPRSGFFSSSFSVSVTDESANRVDGQETHRSLHRLCPDATPANVSLSTHRPTTKGRHSELNLSPEFLTGDDKKARISLS